MGEPLFVCTCKAGRECGTGCRVSLSSGGRAFATTPDAVREEDEVDPEKVVASPGKQCRVCQVDECKRAGRAWSRRVMIAWNRSHDGGCDGTKWGR